MDLRGLALLLAVATGFGGLAQEVAWQRVLATLLGSHSEATAAVLALFLGGLAAGYRLFGAASRRWVESAAAQGRPPRLLLPTEPSRIFKEPARNGGHQKSIRTLFFLAWAVLSSVP